MRAAVLRRPAPAPQVEELSLEAPGPGEVVVALRAAGVCHSDVHLADGDWGEPGPVVLGHEGAGVVEAVGEGVTSPAPGDFVALNWHYPCLRCTACQGGRQWLCGGSNAARHRRMDGSVSLRDKSGSEVAAFLSLGTFAERALVPAQAAVALPGEVPAEVAALIGCCVSTGVGAVLNSARVEPGQSVAVFGLGGVGLAIVMGAVLAGASEIVVVDRVPAKLDLAVALGATTAVEASDDAAREIKKVTAGGVDHAFEAIGLPATIEQAIRCLRRGGTGVLVGLAPFGARASFDIFSLVDASRRIVGCSYGSSVAAIDFPRLARLYMSGRLPIDALVERRISLPEVGDALEALRRGEGRRRVVVF